VKFLSFFSKKKVLITGHTGFKGGWLSLWLVKLGAEVIGYSLEPPTKPNFFEALELDKKITHIIGDIRDAKKLLSVFKEHQPEIVFHLAAQPLVRLSYKEPELTYETNVMGTLNVLEAVRKTGSARVVIVITSDKCYENKEWFYGYREIDALGGYDPYSSSKACVEILVSSYRRSFGLPLATCRAGNVVGGGDWQLDRLIPDCVKALSRGEPIKIRNPHAIRPWQHVLEPLYGYLLLAVKMWEEPDKYAEAWNFGPFERDMATVQEVVEKVIKFWGSGNYEVEKDTSFHEAGLLRLDISKAMMKLGWRPKWDLDTALERTVKWYKFFYKGKTNMFEYSLQEIRDYEEEWEQ